MTRPYEQVEQARRLHELHFNHCQIARALDIPRPTIRQWLSSQRPRDASDAQRLLHACQRCLGTEALLGPDYVYMLGMYLGDGHLSCSAKGVWRLRIFQDQRYTGLIAECRLAIGVLTRTRVALMQQVGCVEIYSDWKHWIHLFPQHGPGLKWLRPIVMEPWQDALIGRYPAQLIRGLIHSDGCRSMNSIARHWGRREHRYSYPRYFFTNASDDIRSLFTETCDALGVRWTQTGPRIIAVSRRADVAFLDTFIGPKL